MKDRTSPLTQRPFSVSPLWIGTSVLLSALVTITSLCGIFLETTYSRETSAWAIQAVGQDYANLAVVTVLLVSTWFVARHSLRGYLVWLGSYLYLIYAFAIYAFAVHFQFLFPAYVLILGLSFYTLVGGLMTADRDLIALALQGNPRANALSVFLLIIGFLFSLLWLSEIIPNIRAGTVSPGLVETGLLTNPVHVLDLAFLLPGMILTSFLLRRGDIRGSLMTVPLLVFAATMGLGILAIFGISALRELPVPVLAGVMVGTIVMLSTALTYRFLKELKVDS